MLNILEMLIHKTMQVKQLNKAVYENGEVIMIVTFLY